MAHEARWGRGGQATRLTRVRSGLPESDRSRSALRAASLLIGRFLDLIHTWVPPLPTLTSALDNDTSSPSPHQTLYSQPPSHRHVTTLTNIR